MRADPEPDLEPAASRPRFCSVLPESRAAVDISAGSGRSDVPGLVEAEGESESVLPIAISSVPRRCGCTIRHAPGLALNPPAAPRCLGTGHMASRISP